MLNLDNIREIDFKSTSTNGKGFKFRKRFIFLICISLLCRLSQLYVSQLRFLKNSSFLNFQEIKLEIN